MSGLPRLPVVPVLLAAVSVAGCDLDEVTVAEPAQRVVAEAFVVVDSAGPRARALLHRTAGTGERRSVPGARIRLTWDDDSRAELRALARSECLLEGDSVGGSEVPDAEGSCYGLDAPELAGLGPGGEVAISIDLAGGGSLRGESRIPGDFALVDGPGDAGVCHLPPATLLPLVWTPSEGAWAYAAETLIAGLPSALPDPVPDLPSDPLFLLGLSISARDTSIVYPRELGVFDRFDLDRSVALALQEGLPAGTSAWIGVAALDRNYVNWVRGGSFNPSGQVRIPSLVGDGSGVLGTLVVRSFRVDTEPGTLPACRGAGADGPPVPTPGSPQPGP